MRLPQLILVSVVLAFSLDAHAKATCTCRITLTKHDSSNPRNDYRPLLIDTVPNRSAQIEVKIGNLESCRKRCRDEFGADGSVSAAADAAKNELRKRAEQAGKPFNWCGGWLDTSLDSKKGNLGWHKGITGGPISIGGVRTCAQVPPGLAKTCCCGPNTLDSFSPYPSLNWAINTNGHFDRIWWDQKEYLETIKYPHFLKPLVSGSLQQDPFGDGVVALNEAGEIVRTIKKSNGQWATELIMPEVVRQRGGVRLCGMISTVRPKFAGIWAITGDSIVRFYVANSAWTHDAVQIGNHGSLIAPSSFHEIGDGRIAGTLNDGQRWNVWFADGDPHKMRFDYSAGRGIAVSAAGTCGAR